MALVLAGGIPKAFVHHDCHAKAGELGDDVHVYSDAKGRVNGRDIDAADGVSAADFEEGAVGLLRKIRQLNEPPYFYWCYTDRWRKHVVLREYESVSGVRLTAEEYSALQKPGTLAMVLRCADWGADLKEAEASRDLPSSLTVNWDSGTASTAKLTAGAWVGTFALPNLVIELRPKFPSEYLLMVHYMHSAGEKPEDVPLEVLESPVLSFMLALPFAQQLEKMQHSGLLQGFKRLREESHVCCGQIDFAALARSRGALVPVTIRRSAVVRDIDENRLLKAALRKLLSATAWQAPSMVARLRRLMLLFQRVSDLDLRGGKNRVRRALPRTRELSVFNRHYAASLRLARAIILSHTPTADAGREALPSVLINMPRLFEDFVRRGVRERFDAGACGKSGCRCLRSCKWRVLPRDTLFNIFRDPVPVLGADGKVHEKVPRSKPDLVVAKGREVVFVADMKYYEKDLSVGCYYQMLAYCHRLRLRRGMLICARDIGDDAAAHVYARSPSTGARGGAGGGETVRVHVRGARLFGDAGRGDLQAQWTTMCAAMEGLAHDVAHACRV